MDYRLSRLALVAMGERGESAYEQVDGEETHDIPTQACRGRAATTWGKTFGSAFSGYINMRTGRMRFDCADAPEFFFEVDLSKVPAIAAAPGNPVAVAAACDFERRSKRMRDDGEVVLYRRPLIVWKDATVDDLRLPPDKLAKFMRCGKFDVDKDSIQVACEGGIRIVKNGLDRTGRKRQKAAK